MYTYKDIIKENHKNIRKKSNDVLLPLTCEDKKILNDMNTYLLNGYDEEKVKKYNIRPGVGLSAVQINVLKRMFVICVHDEENHLENFAVINPVIISHSEQLCYLFGGEGCLSVDRETKGIVHRYLRIKARYYEYNFLTEELTLKENYFTGYKAIIFQHELDHLNGILFIDHIDKLRPFTPKENAKAIII